MLKLIKNNDTEIKYLKNILECYKTQSKKNSINRTNLYYIIVNINF